MTDENKRTADRTRTLLAGSMRFGHGLASFPCQVRDLTETGARLVTAPDALVPDHFELAIPKRNLLVEVEVRWRTKEAVGVAFLRPENPDDPEVRLKALEAENATLRRRVADLVRRLDSYGDSEAIGR